MKFNQNRWGPTEDQKELMDELGIEYNEGTTKAEASELIAEALEQRNQEREDWG